MHDDDNVQYLLALHSTISQNIAFSKRQMWMLVYYVLLSDAAIAGIFLKFFKDNSSFNIDYTIFFVLIPAWIIYLFALYIVMAIHKSLYLDDVRIRKILRGLPDYLLEIVCGSNSNRIKTEKVPFSKNYCPYTLSFVTVMSIGILLITSCSLAWRLWVAFISLAIEILLVIYLYKTFKAESERYTNDQF